MWAVLNLLCKPGGIEWAERMAAIGETPSLKTSGDISRPTLSLLPTILHAVASRYPRRNRYLLTTHGDLHVDLPE
jgi:hypothetical protein